MRKIYCFDIDGTLCSNTEGDYAGASPFAHRIAAVNALKEAGHVINLFTARGTTTGIDWKAFTEEQLAEWGLNYDRLFLGKPHFDYLIDDKAINPETFFGDVDA